MRVMMVRGVVICLLGVVIGILYMGNEEVEVREKGRDVGEILGIERMREDGMMNGKGEMRVG